MDERFRPVRQAAGHQRAAATHPSRRLPPDTAVADREVLVGHSNLREDLLRMLEEPDTATLFLVSGPVGSGKSAVARWLRNAADDRFVDVESVSRSLAAPLAPDGSDIGELITKLRFAVTTAGERAILVYDNADHALRPSGVTAFVRSAILDLKVGSIVVMTTTALSPDDFPITTRSASLDGRDAMSEEFQAFLDASLRSAGQEPEGFSQDLRESLYLLSAQTTNFGDLQYVISLLLEYARAAHDDVTGVDVLQHILAEDDAVRRLGLPAASLGADGRLRFRRKDKSELLADVLIRSFPSIKSLADVARERLPRFDERLFATEGKRSLWDAVIALCLTHSPRDLVVHLLGPSDIRDEIDGLRLDPSQLFDAHEETANLLVRGLGFTLIEKPRGLTALRESVSEARVLLDDQRARADVVRSAALTVVSQVESALFDLLNFWSVHLYGSLETVVNDCNKNRGGSKKMRLARLTTGEVVELLSFLNSGVSDEGVRLRLGFLGIERPVPDELLHAAKRFTELRNRVVHDPIGAMNPTGPAPEVLKRRCRALAEVASEVLKRATEGCFPMAIKLSEIVFDEYSRTLFRAIDSDDNEIRFTFTEEKQDDLVVAAHYYMLPAKRISLDPHVVARWGGPVPVMFDRAEAYEKASSTQRQQAEPLLKLLHLADDECILDVGCATGALTAEISRRVPDGLVRGIDNSERMVRRARLRAEAERLANLEFERADIRDYEPDVEFDVVVSNSAMHWVQPPEKGYRQLFRLLRQGGRLAVHQGGKGNYRGLQACASAAVRNLDLGKYFAMARWQYPVFYPSREELQGLLEGIGFVDVSVEAVESDGTQYPHLVRDFTEAGLLPFLNQLPAAERDYLRAEFLELARLDPPELYTHRLYATARRP